MAEVDCITRHAALQQLCGEFTSLTGGWRLQIAFGRDPRAPDYGKVIAVVASPPDAPPALDPPEDPAREPEEPAVP